MNHPRHILPILLALVAFVAPAAPAQQLKLVQRPPDPHGSPRPARDATNVPLRTSIYFELELKDPKNDQIQPDSVTIRLTSNTAEPMVLLQTGSHFNHPATGWLRRRQPHILSVYAEPAVALKPETKYTVHISAKSKNGSELSPADSTWTFTTEPAPQVHPVTASIDFSSESVHWHGAFFSGLCNVLFCTRSKDFAPTYDLMLDARKQHPRAWTYQRDFWMTGTDETVHTSPFPSNLPNIVRERETRHITSIDAQANHTILHLEDFFGHEQYAIPSNRPLSDDYHAGDEVLIADGVHDARAKVLSADDIAHTVTLDSLPTPTGGWKLDYAAPLPTHEDPDAPGLFPRSGTYLRKFKPHGTPCYYWGRLDKEWDLVHRHYGRRLLVNFADAPGDLSIDGRNWNTVKDYVEWHETVRAITNHLIDRYGDDCLTFTWSIFNEPDLGILFWRNNWDELQRFYDYTTDAICRAFEDRGYDASKVFVGGLELGGIFGTHLKLQEFLAHCSPTASATAKGALLKNAAFADPRLDGKRSKRVESLCRDHAGKGAPCDFVSVHAYNRSEGMASKLKRAKEMALEIDPDYYRNLWVNSHESCPDWAPPPDEAAADAYLGNGYFPTWCADVIARQLRQANADPRYSFGETLLTVWPPIQNFAGLNAITRVLHCDDNNDGKTDRLLTIPNPIFHALNLISDFGDKYWPLPAQTIAGHTIAGFASRDDKGTARVLLYSQNPQDTQSRSDAEFDVTLDLSNTGLTGPAQIDEYRFDRDHNTYFKEARPLRDRTTHAPEADTVQTDALARALQTDDPAAQLDALRKLKARGFSALLPVLPIVQKLAANTRDDSVRTAAQAILSNLLADDTSYPRAELDPILRLSECHPTATTTLQPDPNTPLHLTARLKSNGLNILIIAPQKPPG